MNYRKKALDVRAWYWTGMRADYETAPIWVQQISELKNGTLRIENDTRVYLLHPKHWMIQTVDEKGAFPCTKMVFERDYEEKK